MPLPTLRQQQWSSVDLAEDDVQRSDDRCHIRQHVAATEEIHCLEMRKTGSADLALVWLVAPVGYEVDAKLAFRSFDCGIDFPCRNMEAFRIQLEMVDERLHGALHLRPPRR